MRMREVFRPPLSDLCAFSKSIRLNFRISGSLPINAQFMLLAFFGPDRH
jgi:hypothetical protein